MKIVAISDTHGCHRQLKNLPSGDILIHAGDVCNRGDVSQAVDFVEWFSQLDYKFKIFISGNHDQDIGTGKCLIPMALSDGSPFPDNMIFLSHSGTTISNIKIWGAATDPKNGCSTNSELGWPAIPFDTNILITHYPPQGILDQNGFGKHCGLSSVLTKVRDIQPDYHLFGDIHASYGEKKIGKTHFINASLYRARTNKIVNQPLVFEIG